ncbi:MAG: substrate-binding domain-containing protein [Ktedonobacteraceae bacterium]
MNIWTHTRRTYSLLFAISLLVSVLLSACDSGGMVTGNRPVGTGGKGCTKVGILLPDSTSSDRWETKDHPLLVQAVKAAIPNVQIDYGNAQSSSDTQFSQAQADLARGDCMLIVAPHDSVGAAPIVTLAKASNVPVIAYDRLIQSKDLNYYVSFDNVTVGQLQGEYIATHYRQYQQGSKTNIVMINGSQTDSNALLFSTGSHAALDPLFANGTLKNISETFTPDWNNSTAQAEMEAYLADQHNDIQIAYVANDGMANSVITALRAAGLNGKVLVTGQDATQAGIHNILTGEQAMTVYKPIGKLAQSVGELVKALYDGSNVNTLTKNTTSATFDGGNIPSILDTPITVDRGNIATTVITDKFIMKKDVCTGVPAGTANVC